MKCIRAVVYAVVAMLVVHFSVASADPVASKLGRGLYLVEAESDGFTNIVNSIVSTGSDGVLLVDTADPGVYDWFRAGIDLVTTDPVDVIVNTHWHADHTGLNADFVLNEQTSRIIADVGVGPLLASGSFNEDLGVEMPPLPDEAQPTETIAWGKFMSYNGQPIVLVPVDDAHSDTDMLVYFVRANVVHAGDIYFGGYFPFIDRATGGSIEGMIRAGRFLLATTNCHTKIIPTHGPPGDRAALQAYVDMLELSRGRVQALIDQGMSEEETIAAAPLADLEPEWGWSFMPTDFFTVLVYRSLTQ